MQHVTPPISREPIFHELDDIIRIKLAEAQMFQTRAYDARKEAEEAEEMRRQKLEELQTLENAHQKFQYEGADGKRLKIFF
ncbi:protein OBERON 4 [Tanacetum coccineum]